MDALTRLVEDGVLTAEQERAVEEALAAGRGVRRGWLPEAGGYLGALLLLTGALPFGADAWVRATRLERAGLLAGFALLFAVAGLVAGGLRAWRVRPLRRRLAGMLYGLGVIPAGAAVAVAVPTDQALYGGLVALALAVAGLVLTRGVPGLVATVGASVWALIGLLGDVVHAGRLTGALLGVGLGLAWSVLAILRRVPGRSVALALGIAIALAAARVPDLREPWPYGIELAIGLGALAAYPVVRNIVLLVAGIVGLTFGITTAVGALASGTLSQAVILAVGGTGLVAASLLGLRLLRHR